VDLEPVLEDADAELLESLIRRHAELTGSQRAQSILRSWPDSQARFIKVFPRDLKRALGMNVRTPRYTPPPVEALVEVQHG
jgi:glutamate synthase (NADPH) large chain